VRLSAKIVNKMVRFMFLTPFFVSEAAMAPHPYMRRLELKTIMPPIWL
jgi:hypothetical protein